MPIDNRVISQALDQERVYALLKDENWPELLSFIWSNSDLIATDEILQNATKICEQVFFNNIENEKANESFPSDLATFVTLHSTEKHLLSDANFRRTVVLLVEIWADRDLAQAKSYADLLPDEDLCKTVILRHQATLPKLVEHSQNRAIRVTQNKNVSLLDARATLFKSKQELEFFYGVRNCFPHFIVYPNVALSCLFDLEIIKNGLKQNEIDYFFRAIVDCVVFDNKENLLLPAYFFELDSVFHDSAKAKEKDDMKDRIFAAAGQTLLRIRKSDDDKSRADFEQLVREITENA